ncbi:hypothetical protein KA344_11415 [bacterium]|nr:hypothetical protein [bacterium]
MSLKPSEVLEAARVKQKFGKGSELTKVFEEWDEQVRVFLIAQAQLEDDEVPILAYYRVVSKEDPLLARQKLRNEETSVWFLLTTRRVLCHSPDQKFQQLRLDEIESVAWSSGPDGWPGRDPSSPPDTLVYTENGRGHCRFYSPWLAVSKFSGERFEVFLEQGKVLISVRHLLWQLSGGWKIASARAAQASLAMKQSDSLVVGSDAYRAMRLGKDFQKNGDAYLKYLFQNLAPDKQEFMLIGAQLQLEELPVFAFVEDSETWFFATSRRVLWSRPSFRHQLRYGQIRKMGMSELEAAIRQSHTVGTWDAQKNKIGMLKSSSPWFYFVDDSDVQWDVLLPPGGPMFAIWSAMRFMVQLERIHPRQA